MSKAKDDESLPYNYYWTEEEKSEYNKLLDELQRIIKEVKEFPCRIDMQVKARRHKGQKQT